jgi:hypothetical protein
MFYWLLVAIGALEAQHGLETDTDADGDLDLDGHLGSWLSGVVHFINLGEVPIMVMLSVLALCLWTGSLIANFYFTDHQALLALACLVPNFLLSVLATRYLTLPLKQLFRMVRRAEGDEAPLVGRPCRITTSSANPSFGQAEVETGGAPLLIDVRTLDGVTLPRGTNAVIFRADVEQRIYYVVEVPDPQLP